MIKITYNWNHTGNNPLSLENVMRGPAPRIITDFIKEQVENDMTWANIKAMLRIEKATLVRLIEYGTGAQVPIALAVNYQQVYYQMQKILDRRAKLNPDFARSLELWGIKIRNKNKPINGFWMSRNLEAYERGMFVVAFLSKWQLKILRQEGDIVCMDSTHNTCIDGTKKYCYLYTLVVRCRVTGKGKLVCWMITNSESWYPVCIWLEWLKDEFDFIPAKIMIDNSDTEIAAINQTYNDVVDPVRNLYNNNVKILICHWHVIKAWKGKIISKLAAKTGPGISIKTTQQKKEKRQQALEYMLDMVLSISEVEFGLNYDASKAWCLQNEAEWESQNVFAYFEGYYLDKKEKWSRAWRQGTYNLDTNNYIESWHRHLKEVYMARIKKQRVDVLVYLLWDVVLPDFMQDHLKYTAGISTARENDAEWFRQERANDYSDDEAQALIVEEHVDSIKISSFTIEDKVYLLQIDARNNTLVSCPCEDFTMNNTACKHMYLVNRVKSIGLPEKDSHLPMIAFDNRREEQEAQVTTVISDEERRNVLNEGFANNHQLLLYMCTYASTEFNTGNYDLRAGPHFSKWQSDLLKTFNEMKTYRNNPTSNSRQHRF